MEIIFNERGSKVIANIVIIIIFTFPIVTIIVIVINVIIVIVINVIITEGDPDNAVLMNNADRLINYASRSNAISVCLDGSNVNAMNIPFVQVRVRILSGALFTILARSCPLPGRGPIIPLA